MRLIDADASTPQGQAISPVPASVLEDLKPYGITVKDMADEQEVSQSQPAVTAQQAVGIVRANLGLQMVQADHATLATVTTSQYGQQLESDPALPSRIAPAIDAQRVWLLTYSSVEMPVLGKAGYDGPSTSTGPLVALVDPSSGEFRYALAY